jgi:tRNA(fMet)-specific endonuclease VapC
MILLDTNVVIHLLQDRPAVVANLKAAPSHELAIATITRYELEVGLLRMGNPAVRRKVVNDLCRDMEMVPFDEAAALAAARIRFELQTKGQVIGPLDLLIAGIAVSRGAVLVTNNTAEFARVTQLRCEDWTQ